MTPPLKLPTLLTLLVGSVPAFAQSFTFTPNALIPDPLLSGLTDTRTVTTTTSAILDLNVSLVISGDPTANGDYFATLTHGSGFAVLLNRVGRRSGESGGYADNGFNVTLDDEAANGDIHIYRLTAFGSHDTPVDVSYTTPVTGAWAPDGRNASVSTVTDLSARVDNPLSAFDGLDPNGAWTLFIADVSAGGSGTLVSWSLEITPVPEPAESVAIVGALLLGTSIVCRRLRSS
jgi:subtilisin-like proprotein convertase family protein